MTTELKNEQAIEPKPETQPANETNTEKPAEQEQPVAGSEPVTPEKTIEQKPEEAAREERQNRIQKRIDKLTAEKYELKGRLDAMERMMEQQRHPLPVDDRPEREKYDSDLAYLEAVQDFKLKKIFEETEANRIRTQAEMQQEEINRKIEEARKNHTDYDDVIADSESIFIPQAAGEAMRSSSLFAELSYHLAKNPSEAARLMQLKNPVDQIRAIGQMEAIILNKNQQPAKPKPTRAPEPITPVGSGGGNTEVNPDDLDDKEYFARLKKQKLAKAGIIKH
jgi:hypothetical protein